MDTARGAGWTPEALAHACLEGGARLLQIRAKTLPSGEFLSLCDAVVRASGPFHGQVIVNDRADLARMSGAAGAHVGQDDLPPRRVREQLGPAAIVGVSAHTLPQMELAVGEPVTYVAIGPVFATSTKETGYRAGGLELVRAAVRAAGAMPVVAIGGITLETAPAVVDAGAAAVAVIADLLAGGDPAARVRGYLRALEALQKRGTD